MKIKAQKSIVLKRTFRNLMSTLLPIAKKVISNRINQIKSRILHKIRPNKIKKEQKTLKRVFNRGIKSLENNFSVNDTKNINNTPKIATKPKITTKPKIVDKPEIATKPKIATKRKNVYKNYDKYKNRVIKQLKHEFGTKKSGYIDDDDKEYKGIRDLEYMFEGVSENDEDYYKPEIVGVFKGN